MKRNSLLVATLFVTLIAGAQSINLHMNNGEVIKYNSAEVDYIDFTESSDVIAYTSCPDNHHPHLINLGLPSGILMFIVTVQRKPTTTSARILLVLSMMRLHPTGVVFGRCPVWNR